MMTDKKFMELYDKLPKKVRKKFTKKQVEEAAKLAVEQGSTFEAALNLFKQNEEDGIKPVGTVHY